MKQTQLFTKTKREAPKDETSRNAQLLIRGGFIHKEMSGVYSFLPLGLIVLTKIIGIIREEMNAIGGQEILMSGLQDPAVWQASDRWDEKKVDAWFKTKLTNGQELGLSFTHEEPITRAMKSHISSYRDLPQYVYQFQTKFRNEMRSQGGLLRTREFIMKDLYSFNKSTKEQDEFYEKAIQAYKNIFKRIGIGDKTYLTFASGGVFSKYSHEFQTICEAGEDTIYVSKEKNMAINKEVLNEEGLKEAGILLVSHSGEQVNERIQNLHENTDSGRASLARMTNLYGLQEQRAIEVGNIFKFADRYSKPLGLTFTNEKGQVENVLGGSYGIAPSRSMGTIVELFNDENGIIWPESVAPFKYHILCDTNSEEAVKKAEELYQELTSRHEEVLLDDRKETIPVKIKDADLIGCPVRIVVSKKSLEAGGVEVKERGGSEAVISPLNSLKLP